MKPINPYRDEILSELVARGISLSSTATLTRPRRCGRVHIVDARGQTLCGREIPLDWRRGGGTLGDVTCAVCVVMLGSGSSPAHYCPHCGGELCPAEVGRNSGVHVLRPRAVTP